MFCGYKLDHFRVVAHNAQDRGSQCIGQDIPQAFNDLGERAFRDAEASLVQGREKIADDPVRR